MVIEEAINKAAGFLLSKQNKAGWWIDFETLAGFSDEWVSAYVACALADTGIKSAEKPVSECWKRLTSRRFISNGWGYNRKVPSDTDTTGWALYLAEKTKNLNHYRAKRALKYLRKAITPEGGIPTYPREAGIRFFTHLKKGVSFNGWCSPHLCVTSSVANLDSFKDCKRLIAYLRDTQLDDGYWRSYWWCEKEYATCFAVKALARQNDLGDFQRIKRALEWSSEKISTEGFVQNSDFPQGSPFATALALQILLVKSVMNTEKQETISGNCINWLLNEQWPDGSWQTSARLRIPSPDEQYPDRVKKWNYNTFGGGSIRKDQNRLFTTATVLNALNQYRKTGI